MSKTEMCLVTLGSRSGHHQNVWRRIEFGRGQSRMIQDYATWRSAPLLPQHGRSG